MSRRAAHLIVAILVAFGATVADAAEPAANDDARSALAGVWELRNDDFRSGKIILRPDGGLIASSDLEEVRDRDFHGAWTLVSQRGSKYVLEFGSAPGALGSSRVTLVLTCRDAFTIVEVQENAVRIPEQQRFVRTGPAPPTPR